MDFARRCPDDIVSPVWVSSSVPHALPSGERILWNVLVFLQVVLYIDDVFFINAPVFRWVGECQSSRNVSRT